MSELSDKLLSAPVSARVKRPDPEKEFTSEIEVGGDTLQLTLRDEIGVINEGTALRYLEEEGQNPDDWEVTHFRKLKWGPPDSPYESVKFSFRRVRNGAAASIDELVERVNRYTPRALHSGGEHGFVVALGDMQFGKIDGDGVDGTLQRTLDCLAAAKATLAWQRERFPVGHVHIAWLGDHVEGFSSQGGANAWRTGLTMSEQIRLTRRVMLYALETFAPLAPRVTMAAVPGNHGEPQRFQGKGQTRYNDSHDTESLVAVSDAAAMNRQAFGHVQFYVPELDEMTLLVDVAGTAVGHAHGHQWRPGKHFQWWEGQAFGGDSPVAQADLLLAGHLHHFHIDSSSKRRFIQVPSLESESTWWRHRKGEIGDPGIVTAITKDGKTNLVEVVQ